MKIAFVYDAIYPYIKGGAERRYYELARLWSGRHEIHFFGMKFWQGDDIVRRDDGVVVHGVCPSMPLYVDVGRRSIRQALYFAVRLLWPLLKENFDLVECPSAPFFTIFTCKLYTLIKRCPFVVVWLEYWGDYWYEYLGKLGAFGKLVEKVALFLPDHIIAISDHTRNALISHGAVDELVTTTQLGIKLSEIETVQPAIDHSDLIFAGRLIKEKNVNVLVEVVAELVKRGLNPKCFIIGDGPEKENLVNLCARLELGPYITFWGFLPHHESVYALMKSSKVFAFFSTREGFGLVVPEANACGLPVVVVKARYSAAPSLVKHGESGILCNLDACEIADAIFKLLTDDEMYTRMKCAAIDWANQFDWNVTASVTEQVYANLLPH